MASNPRSRMIIFDDGRGQFGPMGDLRAAFEIRTGMRTTAGRLKACRPKTLCGYWVPEALRPLVATRSDAPVNVLPNEEILYCVNGRWALPDPDRDLDVGTALVEEATGHVVLACLRHADAEYFLQTGELHERVQIERAGVRMLYKYPWDVLGSIDQTITLDILSHRLLDAQVHAPATTIVGPHPVEIHATARLGPNVVLDAEQGPIVIHDGATVRAGAIICGPASIGRAATVVERAHIKANTVLGPVCKVGGEVGSTIFQGWSNKTHDGHLGDSWVGKWVNLGAGTTNSNLLNTYGDVSMRIEPEGPRHRTGLTFLGAVIGDHVKTAISTRLMTGSVVGTGAMIATSTPPPTTVRRFAWLTDDGERTFRFDKFEETMRAMMTRRDRTPSPEYMDIIRSLHASATS